MENTEISLASLHLNELQAMVELMWLAATSDGSVHEAERSEIRAHVIAATGGQLSGATLEALLDGIQRIAAGGPEADRLAAILGRLPDLRLRKFALGLAANVVVADGRIAGTELAFLRRAATTMGIDLQISDAIVARVEP